MSEAHEENYLDVIARMGITLPDEPGKIKGKEYRSPYGKTPFSCPRCEELRGTVGKGTILQSGHEDLMWQSFGMCSSCYLFIKNNPELAANNTKLWKEKQEKLKTELEALKQATKYRVYASESKFGRSGFLNTLSQFEFFRYPTLVKHNGIDIEAIKTKKKMTLEEAQKLVGVIESKEIEAWYLEEVNPL